MKINFQRYISYLLAVFAVLSFSLGACTEKNIEMPDDIPTDKGEIEKEFPGFSLGVAVAEDVPSGVAEEMDYDDYVETKDHFRVFFFDKNGQFIVNPMDRTVTPLGTDDKGRKKFYVRIPMNYIEDRENHIYDVEALKYKLRHEPFKIAILANWPNPNSEIPDKRYPNWGWNESVLNPAEYLEDGTVRKIMNINDLHHLQENEFYKNNQDALGFVMEGGQMGIKKDWIIEEKSGNGETIFKGKPVNENSLIPMYGVQDFDELGDNWEEGSTFFLSPVSDLEIIGDDDIDYNYKDIFLIRSVAKIEVYLSDQVNNVRVYNPNRYSFCEPVDVTSPSEKYWPYQDGDIDHGSLLNTNSNDINKACEWFMVGNHKSWFDSTNSGTDYKAWLSWFYNSWKFTPWKKDILSGNFSGWDFSNINVPETEEDSPTSPKYPHIFNPDFNRIEYAEFNEEGQVDGWWKYTIYMPDTYMVDPAKPGDNTAKKIAYVQYEKKNGSKLRFYFADSQPKDNTEEEVLKVPLWPIVRNHKYTFYVRESEVTETPTIVEIRARVSDWGYNKLDKNQW